MKKFLKWFGIILGSIILLGFIAGWIASEKKPVGEPGAAAEALAQKMQEAINKEAWDSTRYVTWTFRDAHDFVWNKTAHLVQVEWGDNRVILDEKTQQGKAWVANAEVEGEKASKLLKTAWALFCNDSFWLNAPAKAFDPGTSRSMVKLDDGREGVMVSYSSGGVTPGDSYLWIVDENGLPKAWKMWVNIIPIGGIELSWENWITLSTGAKIASTHKGIGELVLTNIKGGMNLSDIGLTDDPFAVMQE